MTILLATRNRKKLEELARILADAGIGQPLVALDDVPAYEEVPETGSTFVENALLKAREGVRHTGLVTIADDSGLTVAAMNGMPGIFSARWSGRHGDDAANLALLLAQLTDVADDRRTAAFVCAAAFVTPDGVERVAHGEVQGSVIREPRGGGGFGYDPIFQPTGFAVTTAELPPAEKDAISHRGHAFRAIAADVAQLVG